jgi:subtilisin family serine protease
MKRSFILSLSLMTIVALVMLAFGVSPAQSAAKSNRSETYAPDSLLVRFQPGAVSATKAEGLVSLGAQMQREFSLVPGLENWKLPPGLSVSQALKALQNNPNVLYAEPDYIVTVDLTPNDPSWGNLYGMGKINAPLAWDTFTGDANFVVAVIDTGIAYNHPDLAANMWQNPGEIPNNGIDDDGNGYIDDVYGWDFANNDNDPLDGNGHGTHTAGTIGAVGNNGVGVAGVNWNVKLAALKFLSDSGSGYTSNAVLAIQYAVMVVFKVTKNCGGGGGNSQALYDAINAAKSAGHIFVAAAGNNGTNNDSIPFYPANYNLDNVISVAATDSNDAKASFSNYGATMVDLGAPGVNIYSTIPGGYASYSGTSMASPHVAGVAALVYSYHPGWTYQQVRTSIFNSVRKVASMNGITVTGGIVDAAGALNGSVVPPTPTTQPSPTPTTRPSPTPTTRPSPTPTTRPSPTPTTRPSPTPTISNNSMHLGGLAGKGTRTSSTKWSATVTVTIHNGLNATLQSATVTGTWSNGASGSASCITSSRGTCTITKTGLTRSTVPSVTFTVNSVSRTSYIYDSARNDVLNSVTILRP